MLMCIAQTQEKEKEIKTDGDYVACMPHEG